MKRTFLITAMTGLMSIGMLAGQASKPPQKATNKAPAPAVTSSTAATKPETPMATQSKKTRKHKRTAKEKTAGETTAPKPNH